MVSYHLPCAYKHTPDIILQTFRTLYGISISIILETYGKNQYHPNGRLKGNRVARKARELKASPADVVRALVRYTGPLRLTCAQISFTACRDEQTSVDTVKKGVSVGAMSYVCYASII